MARDPPFGLPRLLLPIPSLLSDSSRCPLWISQHQPTHDAARGRHCRARVAPSPTWVSLALLWSHWAGLWLGQIGSWALWAVCP